MTKLLSVLLLLPVMAWAEDRPVNIGKEVPSVTVPVPGGEAEIRRIPDNANQLTGDWARTSRPCPPFCIQPMTPAPGVTTIGELELMEMLQDPEVVVMDSRTPEWFAGGSIPGAINVPYTQVIDRLGDLGCEVDFDGYVCEAPKRVALFCNGNWCGQSPTAIRNMIEAGFPADHISYYRGGIQAWRLLGLSVTGE
ncbi:rhodanese-like domain-containing protein [Thalassovita aquimarina]|uniref:Rhodanese-like domain-containing protein n=1 Tax=Thalassovita aquimarina TaxID=2785917 RepID=A0ABS5HPL1_9RHOB|nr:rhodanese-like domain-containing protein [Thalassovita aquimarina]MBR9650869.1 rhodanese-like domain-containing protein [Thalassovita aquimarina]